MKKLLLTLSTVALSLGASAENYCLGDAIPKGGFTEGEHKVIFQVITKNSYGFLHSLTNPADASQVYFGSKDMTMTAESIFDESFVYTINVASDGSFTIKNSVGGYAPKSTTSSTSTYYYSDTTEENAASFTQLDVITTESIKDEYVMFQMKDSDPHLEVHLDGTYNQWTYYSTGTGGQQDAGGVAGSGNTTRTAVAFKVYYAEVTTEEPEEPEVQDITQVTNATVGTAITDGAVIALQCLDTNGGSFYYFNGDQLKTATSQYSNLFKVVAADDGGFCLQQCLTGKYVGGSTTNESLVRLVNDKSNANVFTAACVSANNWTTVASGVQNGVNTIRFTVKGTTQLLNTNQTGSVPKYFNGTGGFSVWYVFVYSEKAVSELGKEYLTALKTGYVKEDTPGFISPDADLSAINEKIESENVLTVDEINTTATEFVNYVNLDGPFNGVYTITNKNGRGYLCYAETQSEYVWTSAKDIEGVTLPATDNDYSKWGFVQIGDNTFLFNVGAQAFIYPTGTDANTPWCFSLSSAENIDLSLSTLGIGTVEISSTFGEVTYCMSISTGFDQPVGGYYAESDPGVPFVFERVGDLSEELKSEMISKNPTAIEEITVDAEKVQGIYDLQGRRLSAPVKGINIINGKKVLVK